jgi:hypothetical protein
VGFGALLAAAGATPFAATIQPFSPFATLGLGFNQQGLIPLGQSQGGQGQLIWAGTTFAAEALQDFGHQGHLLLPAGGSGLLQ